MKRTSTNPVALDEPNYPGDAWWVAATTAGILTANVGQNQNFPGDRLCA